MKENDEKLTRKSFRFPSTCPFALSMSELKMRAYVVSAVSNSFSTGSMAAGVRGMSARFEMRTWSIPANESGVAQPGLRGDRVGAYAEESSQEYEVIGWGLTQGISCLRSTLRSSLMSSRGRNCHGQERRAGQ